MIKVVHTYIFLGNRLKKLLFMSLQNLMVTICIDFWFQIIPLSAFGLGVWQVKRRSWKLDLLKDLEDRTTAPPVPLPFDQESLSKLEYCKVNVRGEFQHDQIVYIG